MKKRAVLETGFECPPQGWDRRPNHLLPDLLWFVAFGFGWACFFNWMAAAIDAALMGV